MKLSILAISALAICSAALAYGPKTPKTITCAVMPAHKVDIAKATKDHMYTDYKGKRYFFCCAGCPDAFKKDSAKFAKTAASIPTPKAKKK